MVIDWLRDKYKKANQKLSQPVRNVADNFRVGIKPTINQYRQVNNRISQAPRMVAQNAKYFVAPQTSPRYNQANNQPRLSTYAKSPNTPLVEDILSIPKVEQSYNNLRSKVKPLVNKLRTPIPKMLQPTENVRARDFARELALTPEKLREGVTNFAGAMLTGTAESRALNRQRAEIVAKANKGIKLTPDEIKLANKEGFERMQYMILDTAGGKGTKKGADALSNEARIQIKQSYKGNIYLKDGENVIKDIPKTVQNDIYGHQNGEILTPDRMLKANKYLNSKGYEITYDGGIKKLANQSLSPQSTQGASSPKTTQPDSRISLSRQKTTQGATGAPTSLNDDLVGQFDSSGQPIRLTRSQGQTKIKSGSFDETIPQKDRLSQLADDTKRVIGGAEVKERSFGKRVRLSENTAPEVRELVGGNYVVKSNKQLQKDATRLIKENIDSADQMAMNPRNANDIEVGNQLIAHYQSKGQHQKAADIANAMNQSLTEGGQFVQAASLYDKTTPGGIQRFAQSEVQAYNKAHPNKKITVDDKTMDVLFKKAQEIQKMAEGRERTLATGDLFNEVADIIPTSGWKKAITLWKAGLLTSPRTHLRNVVGNTLNVGGEIAKDPIAAVMDVFMATRTGTRTKTFTLAGMGKGASKGLASAKDMIYKGFDPEKTIEKFDVKRVNWGKSKMGKLAETYTNAVFRALGAADKPYYHSAMARSLYDQAGAAAINAGKKGNKEFIEKLVLNPTDDMLKIATRDAETAVFQQSSTAGDVLRNLKNAIKSRGEFAEAAGEFFLPFTQVPSGVASQLVSYSPLGLGRGAFNAAKTMISKNSGLQRQAAEDIGRGIVGTGIAALGYELYKTGNMTGKYPADAKEREQWKLEGKQENSVKVAGKWRKLSAIGPQASLLVTGAQYAESEESGDAGAASVAASVGSEFLDQPFIQGMSVPLDVLKDPERNAQKFTNQASASLIPNIVKDVARGTDQYKREAQSPGESLRKSIPLMRNQLTPMRDVYGEPLPEEGGVLKNMFDLFNSTTPKGDSTTQELRRLLNAGEGATPSRLQNLQTIAGEKLKLKNPQLDVIERIAGEKTKQGFDQLIRTPEYQQMSDEDKRKALQKITEDARAVAKLQAADQAQLLDKNKLVEKASDLTKDQKALLTGNTFSSVKRDYDLDKQIDFLDGDYGKLAFLKKKKDYTAWQTEADGLMKMYEEKYTNAETEADKMKYELKIIKLSEEMQKYASYGGSFKKGKKAKKISLNLSMPTRASRASIKLRKPTAPKISLKTYQGGSSGGQTGQRPRSIRVKR